MISRERIKEVIQELPTGAELKERLKDNLQEIRYLRKMIRLSDERDKEEHFNKNAEQM